MFESAKQFCGIESAATLVELAFTLQMIKQFPSIDWAKIKTNCNNLLGCK